VEIGILYVKYKICKMEALSLSLSFWLSGIYYSSI